MKFSVIIPTYGRNNKILRTLNSVLIQTYSEYEVIIIDDNGDGTLEQLETHKIIESKLNKKIKYIKNSKNMGANFSRNKGIKLSDGEYICFLDDDDEFLPNKLQELKKILSKNKYDLLYSKVQLHNEDKNKNRILYRTVKKEKIKEKILEMNFIGGNSTVVLKKNKILEVNGFDESLESCQDWDLWIRLIFLGCNIKEIPKVLVRQNIHNSENRISNNIVKRINGHKHLFKKSKKYLIEFDLDTVKKIRYAQKRVESGIYYDMEEYKKYIKIIKKIPIKYIDIKNALRILLLLIKIRIDRFSIKKLKI